MDCARTALRTAGVEHVTLVYRRTEPFMPAAQEDVNAVRAEGIEVLELLAPSRTTARCCAASAPSSAPGRTTADARPAAPGTFVDLAFDTVIGATGATLDAERYLANGVAVDEHGRPRLWPDLRAERRRRGHRGVRRRRRAAGPDTVVRALADAKTVARAILRRARHPARLRPLCRHRCSPPTTCWSAAAACSPTGSRGAAEAARCLRCDEVCEICVEVCPNRANVAVAVPGFTDERQVVHLDGLCNECGNCGTFCPHAGLPYRDKLTVFWSREDFDASPNVGFLRRGDDYLVRLPSGDVVAHRRGDGDLPASLERVLAVLEAEHPWLLARPPRRRG